MISKLKRIITTDTTPLKVMLWYAATLYSVGLMSNMGNSAAYQYMVQYGHNYTWAALLTVYAWARLASAFLKLHPAIALVTIFIGITVWLFTFLAFWFNRHITIGSTYLMLTMLIAMEFWVSIDTLANMVSDDE